jgi:hypothetical protein
VSYLPEYSTIFIAVRQDIEEVLYGMDIKLGEFFGDTRPNPLEVNNGSG